MSGLRQAGMYAAALAVAVVIAVLVVTAVHGRDERRLARPVTPAQSTAIRQGEAAQSQAARSLDMLQHSARYGLSPEQGAVCASSPAEIGCPGQPQYP